jgi:hypothetical protein
VIHDGSEQRTDLLQAADVIGILPIIALVKLNDGQSSGSKPLREDRSKGGRTEFEGPSPCWRWDHGGGGGGVLVAKAGRIEVRAEHDAVLQG